MIIKFSSQIENEFIRSYFGSWVDQIDLISKETQGKRKFEIKSYWREEISHKFPGWEWAGSGAYRWVLSPNDSYVVKFAQHGPDNESGKKLNELESKKQLEFEGLFPKVYFHHPDWQWIVVEKVEPIMSGGLQDIFSISKDAAFHFAKFLSYHVALEKGSKNLIERRLEGLRASVSNYEDDYKKLKSDPIFLRLANIAMKLGLWEWDLSWGNLGKNKKGELVILDSSFNI